MLPARTICDDIICLSSSACKNAGRIIICITIGSRADVFELLRIKCGCACSCISIVAPATVLVRIEHVAGASTSNDAATRFNSQLFRTIRPQVSITSGPATIPLAIHGFNAHRQVKSIDKANIVKIRCCKGKFSKGCRGFTGSCAM